MKQNLLPYTAASSRAWQEPLVIKTGITTHQLTCLELQGRHHQSDSGNTSLQTDQ